MSTLHYGEPGLRAACGAFGDVTRLPERVRCLRCRTTLRWRMAATGLPYDVVRRGGDRGEHAGGKSGGT